MVDKIVTRQDEESTDFRASTIVLVLRVLLAQFFVALAGLLLIVVMLTLNELSGEPIPPVALFGILFFLFLLVDVIITAIVLMEPARVNYTIRPGEIVVRQGLGGAQERIYKVDVIKAVEAEQSVLGRLFDYGTVHIDCPSLNERVDLVDIPRPHHYASLIEQQITSAG